MAASTVDLTQLIDEELAKLGQEGLQSDERLAEAFIRARTRKGQGPVKIRMELKGKGVGDEVISIAFENAEVDWFELAREVAQKKYRGELQSSADMPAKERARLSRFLQQRGFNYEHISGVC